MMWKGRGLMNSTFDFGLTRVKEMLDSMDKKAVLYWLLNALFSLVKIAFFLLLFIVRLFYGFARLLMWMVIIFCD